MRFWQACFWILPLPGAISIPRGLLWSIFNRGYMRWQVVEGVWRIDVFRGAQGRGAGNVSRPPYILYVASFGPSPPGTVFCGAVLTATCQPCRLQCLASFVGNTFHTNLLLDCSRLPLPFDIGVMDLMRYTMIDATATHTHTQAAVVGNYPAPRTLLPPSCNVCTGSPHPSSRM